MSDPRAEMIRFCRLAHTTGAMRATDGNISCRLPGGNILVTPSGRSKALVTARELVEVDPAGRVVAGRGRPSSELDLHLAAYRLRPEVGAVVHAHSPAAAALVAAGRELPAGALPELLLSLGRVPLVPYATPGSPELARRAEPYLRRYDAMLLDHHGTLALGPDLATAWARSERIEAAAAVVLRAHLLGGVVPLPPEEQARLRALGGHQRPPEPPPLEERFDLVRLPVTTRFATEKIHRDARGEAHLVADGLPLARVGILTLEPGAGHRGGHWHRHKCEGFYVFAGRARVELACPFSHQKVELILDVGYRLWMRPLLAHRITALKPLTFLEFCDLPYDRDDDRAYDFDR